MGNVDGDRDRGPSFSLTRGERRRDRGSLVRHEVAMRDGRSRREDSDAVGQMDPRKGVGQRNPKLSIMSSIFVSAIT